MAIIFTCPRCQKSLTRADADANTKIRCPSCDQKLLVPIPPALSSKTMLGVLPSDKTMLGTLPPQTANTVGLVQQVQPHQPDFPFQVLCPHCQQALVVSSKYAGQHMKCSVCGGTFTVPSPPPRPEVAAENVTANALPPPVPTMLTGPGNDYKRAILLILQEDARIANETKNRPDAGSTPAAFAAAAVRYCDRAEALDLSTCPAEFRVAFRQHLRAWREVQLAASQFPPDVWTGFLVGAWNAFVNNESDGGQSRLKANFQIAMASVKSTWEEVERVGAKHDAAL